MLGVVEHRPTDRPPTKLTLQVSASEYIERATRATLYADTLAYNSHTVMVDMLWAGVPAITLSGGTIAARVGTAVSSASGSPEAAIASLREYGSAVTELLGKGWHPMQCTRRKRLRFGQD